jgi:transcriptional regulator with XRE-family HTH domain
VPGGIRFGTLLKLHRLRRGMALKTLAEQCGLDPGNLSRIEHGERKPPKVETLRDLLRALGVDMRSREALAFLSAAGRDRAHTLMCLAGQEFELEPNESLPPLEELEADQVEEDHSSLL